MRVVSVTVPRGAGPKVAAAALTLGVPQADVRPDVTQQGEGDLQLIDVVDFTASATQAWESVGLITSADYFDFATCAIAVRQDGQIENAPEPNKDTHITDPIE